jgi:hypothetical protein
MRTVLLGVVILTVAAWAASPIGRLTSSGAIEISGKTVPAIAASSVVLVEGDEIVTLNSAAFVQLSNGGRVQINPNSRSRVASTSDGVVLRVLSGSTSAPAGSGLKVIGAVTPAAVSTGVTKLDVVVPPTRSQRCPDGHGTDDGHDCRVDK